jgi:site-specific DNA recombinase
MTENGGKRVGIWIRVSTEDQARGESPEHHEQRARAYAHAKGWTVAEAYHLEGVSGKAVMEHPEAQRMLEHIRSGTITALIFSKLARLARNTRELLEFADIFRANSADLISLQESIDTSSPAGRLFFTMIAAMAEWEREEIAERVRASVPIRAKLGKNIGGQAPFGYRWQGHELLPDPDEAPVRKLLYELFKEHRRKKRVARILNDRGYRTRNGSKFSDTTVARLLHDPTAKGMRRANYTSSPGPSKRWELKPEDEWVWHPCPAIVSEELWDECNRILDEQTVRRKPSRKTAHLFAGIVECTCGTKMYVPSYTSLSHTRKYVCHTCRNKIAVDDLEALFHEQLREFVSSPDDIAAYLNQADAGIAEKDALLDALEAEQRDVEKEMQRWKNAYMKDEISLDAFGREFRPLDERYRQIDLERPRLQAELDALKIDLLSSDQIVSDATDLFRQWPQLTDDQKRNLVEAITDRIVIGADDIEINLIALPYGVIADNKATQRHGFIAATSWNRAG